uniref:Uncharacterized protein n=1 Tax=Arion vulgaris TaxID=1028688 RepID=A0A0B7B7X5_9EUPU
MMTDARIVKNLRVVVTIEQVKGPNEVTVMKMNICPNADAKLKLIMLNRTNG